MEEGKKFDTGFPVPSLPEILIRKDSVKEKVFSASKFAYIYGEAGSGKTTFALSVSGKHPVYIKIPETKMQDISFIYSYFLSSELLNEDKFFEEPFYEFKREIVLQYILNKLIHKRRKVKIIVDDLHNLPENSEMFLFIKDLFRYASRNLFFIFVSRKNPPSFLLKEADRGVFIQSKELRFSKNETSYVARKLGIKNADYLAEKIYGLTKGWPLGSLLLLRSYKDSGRIVKDYVFSYLTEEIFRKENGPVKEFLLKTSIMHFLIPELINEYLGIEKSREILEDLSKRGIFVSKAGRYFFYHEIFREFLLNEFRKSSDFDKAIKKLSNIYLKNKEFGLALELYSHTGDFSDLEYLFKNSTEQDVIKYAESIIRITDKIKREDLLRLPLIRLARAEALYVKGRPENALALLEGNFPCKDFRIFSRYLLVKMKILNSLGIFEKTINLFKENKREIDKGTDDFKAGILYELSRAYFFSGKEDNSSAILRNLYEKIGVIKDYRLRIKILTAYCVVNLHDKGKYGEAKGLYKKIIALSEEHGIITDPMILTNLSFCENDLGESEESLKHVKKALKIANELKWEPRIQSSEIALGHYLLSTGEYDKAESIFKKYISVEDPYLSSSALFGIAEALRKKGLYDKAKYYELKDLDIAKKMNNALIMAQSYFQLGMIYLGQGKKELACLSLTKAVEYARKSGNIYEIARSELILSVALETYGKDYEKHFETAKKIITENKFYYIIYSEKLLTYPFLRRIGEKDFLNMVSSLFGGVDFSVQTFGGLRLLCSGTDVTKKIFKREKERKIFQMLLSEYPKFISQDTLIDTFFRKTDTQKAKHNLSVLISRVKKSLFVLCGKEVITKSSEGYGLNLENVKADFLLFEEITNKNLFTKNKEALKKAVDLYKGDFLPEAIYDDWSTVRRERLFSLYLDTLFRLSEITKDEKEKKGYLEKILEKDEINERAAYELMKCYIALQEKKKALSLYNKIKNKLESDYNLEPDEKLKELYERILHN